MVTHWAGIFENVTRRKTLVRKVGSPRGERSHLVAGNKNRMYGLVCALMCVYACACVEKKGEKRGRGRVRNGFHRVVFGIGCGDFCVISKRIPCLIQFRLLFWLFHFFFFSISYHLILVLFCCSDIGPSTVFNIFYLIDYTCIHIIIFYHCFFSSNGNLVIYYIHLTVPHIFSLFFCTFIICTILMIETCIWE